MKPKKIQFTILSLLIIFVMQIGFAQIKNITVKDTVITIPTYLVDNPDKNPWFYLPKLLFFLNLEVVFIKPWIKPMDIIFTIITE